MLGEEFDLRLRLPLLRDVRMNGYPTTIGKPLVRNEDHAPVGELVVESILPAGPDRLKKELVDRIAVRDLVIAYGAAVVDHLAEAHSRPDHLVREAAEIECGTSAEIVRLRARIAQLEGLAS